MTQVRVRKGLAAITVMTVRAREGEARRRSRASGTVSNSRDSPSSARAGSAQAASSATNSWRVPGTGLRSLYMTWLRIALCQLGPMVGDLSGNVERVLGALGEAEESGADLAVFPELVITGYPPEDLLLKPGFVADNLVALAKVAQATENCAAIVGFVDERVDLYNAAAVCAGGEVRGVYHKRNLPNYSVFDEQRYFSAGAGAESLYLIGGALVGISVCEDAWDPTGPVSAQAAAGAELVVNINASPYYAHRLTERQRMLATRAADASCALVYVNAVGGQDELVFDGASMVFDADGRLVAALPQFEEGVSVFDLEVRPTYRKRLLDPRGGHRAPALPEVTLSTCSRLPVPAPHREPPLAPPLGEEEEIYQRHCAGDPRLRAQKRLPGRGHRPVRRGRLVPGGGHRRRRPGAELGPRRLPPVALHERQLQRGRRGAGGHPRHRLPHDLDRARPSGHDVHAGPGLRPGQGARPDRARGWPKKTSRAACGAWS